MARAGRVSDLAVPGILLVNFTIYYLWTWWPGFNSFFEHNFIASRSAINDYRVWTILTSTFAHHSFEHLLFTTLLLLTIGVAVENLIGSKWFLEYFVVSGAIGAMNHCMISSLLDQPTAPVYGSTGAMTGMAVLAACVFRKKTIYFFKFIPVKMNWIAGAMMAADLIGMFNAQADGAPIGYGSHIAAGVVALAYYHKVLRYRVWRNLKSSGDGQPLVPVKLKGQVGWVIPCHYEETFEDMVVFFHDILGLTITSENAPEDDEQIKKLTRFHTPNGWLEVVETQRSARELYAHPLLSVTVDNLANACRNMDSRNVKMVAPVFHRDHNWAIVYFCAPDGRNYQIQGPY